MGRSNDSCTPHRMVRGCLDGMMVVYAAATFIAVRHEFLEQLDERLHDDFEVAEDRLTRKTDGTIAWTDAHQDGHDDEARVYEVWSPAGEQIHRSGAQTVLPPVSLAATGTSYRYETVIANGDRWRTTRPDRHRWRGRLSILAANV